MDVTQVLLLGAVGGLLPDLLRIAKAKGDLKAVGGVNVLVSLVVLAIIGAVTAYVADAADPAAPTVIASVTAGFAGPELISRLVGGATSKEPSAGGFDAGGGQPGLLGWWSV